MKFTIDKYIILENLMNVARAISTKNVIPVLNGIKFELVKEGLYLTASDSELTIKSFIEAKEIKNIASLGTIIIQSKFIVDIIRKMPSDIIDFEVVDGLKIKISSGTSEYNLNGLDPSEYPQIKLDEHKNPIIINSMLFKTIISQTAFAISNQELRPLLTGLNFKITGDILECVATDSYRLSKKIIELDNEVSEPVDIIIPTRNLNELVKLFMDDNNKVELHIFNNKVIFKFSTIIMMSRLINGSFIDTTALIPKDFSIIMKVNLQDLYNAIDRASLLTNENDKNTVKLESFNDNIVLSSNKQIIFIFIQNADFVL